MQSHFDAKTSEPRIYTRWEKENAFAPHGEGAPYTVMIPPPNVTGVLHMGHALNITLQDILCRLARMRGKRVLWQPGTDHAGIATQLVVEKKISESGRDRREMGRAAFIAETHRWKEQSEAGIIAQLKRLGASCDWSRQRFTLDAGFSEAVRKAFVTLHEQGLIYRDRRLVNWDPHLQTAVSDLEVLNREVAGHFWHFKYPLADGRSYRFPIDADADGTAIAWEERNYIAIATTRPETMLGDGAVAVHPDDARYASLVGTTVILPLVEREIPIIADPYPDPSFGSGAVKITGAHDANDFEVARRHDLPLIDIMDDAGRMAGPIPERYAGMDRFAARAQIVTDMEALGLLLHVEDKMIQQPFGDRSGAVIEPRLKKQWFVETKKLAQRAIAAVESGRTRFIPDSWAKTFFEWMRNIQPWCISRQLWWGHRIPAWYAGDDVFVAENEDTARKQAEAALGPGIALRSDDDVLDTWFSSALWPFASLGWPGASDDADTAAMLKRHYPTTVLVTGFDIIFFWVARMMMQGLHFMDDVPFPDVYVHALVRDAQGRKMSKSKGNVVDPLEMIDRYGADALRFTLTSMAVQGRDIKLSTQRIAGYRNFGSKLWNAARFQQSYPLLDDHPFDPSSARMAVNRWIIAETARSAQFVAAELDAYRFNEAASGIYRFIWNTLCDWYVELIKPVLASESEQTETRRTLAWVLRQSLALLHPFMPFLTEDIHMHIHGKTAPLLIDAGWPDLADLTDAGDADEDIAWVIDAVRNIRSLSVDLNIPAGAVLQIADLSPRETGRLERHGPIIARLTRCASCVAASGIPDTWARFPLGQAVIGCDLRGLIDVAAEKERLHAAIGKSEREIAGIDAKLADENFISRAPADVIAKQTERRRQAQLDTDRLAATFAMLQGQ